MVFQTFRILAACAAITALVVLQDAKTAVAATSGETAAVLSPIDAFVSAIVSNKPSTMAEDFVASPSILDDLPPNSFSGPKAYLAWYRAFTAANSKQKLTIHYLGHGTPHYVHVNGDRAYVVLPADFDVEIAGKPFAESASWTFALSKTDGTWKIASWAWSLLTDTSE